MANKLASLVATVACSGLAYANWSALKEDVDIAPYRAQAAIEAPKVTVTAVRVRAPLGDLQETTQRPLFSPTRRPQVPASEQIAPASQETPVAQQDAAPEATKLPDIRLLGVLHDGSSRTRALLQIQDAIAAGWVDIGSDISGWRLSEVQRDHVVLEAANERKTISLYTRQRSSE